MFNPDYPTYRDLEKKAQSKMPKFAFDYLQGGCFDDVGLKANRTSFESKKFIPVFTKKRKNKIDLSVSILGQTYHNPFGIAPVGLQGLMWPNAPIYLAKAAKKYQIPYVLSTVSSETIENIAKAAEEYAWFQLYSPTDTQIRNDLIARAQSAGYQNLMITIDVPTFGYRPRDYKNRLSMPPKNTLKNLYYAALRPNWCLQTLIHGVPKLKNLVDYMNVDEVEELQAFMNRAVMGPADETALKEIRDLWRGKLIIKGVMSEADAKLSIAIGADAIGVSNHGARQLDCGESTLDALPKIARIAQKSQTPVFFDSGLTSGVDVAIALAEGAQFCFLGRLFIHAVGALGEAGASHAIAMLETQMTQLFGQLGADEINDLKQFKAYESA